MAPPFIPDVPYKIQGLFIITYAYIWMTAFTDNYLDPLPDNEAERKEIFVSLNFQQDNDLIQIFVES